MDITRGSLDEISRPASNSRINNGNKVLSTSLEVLTPEPNLPKVDFYNNYTEDESEKNYEKGEEDGIKKMKSSQEISEENANNGFQLVIQNENQVEECSSSPMDSENDCTENQLYSCSNAPQKKLAKLQKVTAKSTNIGNSTEKDVDPLVLNAIKKMKRLDQILANKQSQERAIKKQGKELRRKLWEEFQFTTSPSSTVITEEGENTSRFLALESPLPETLDCLSEDRTRSTMKTIENMHQKSEASYKNYPDFIKKNIELAKDAANQVVMLEEEKKRLAELLRDTEEETNELNVTEKEVMGWLVPGEGYTPEPVEYHHLAEISAKLKAVISDGDYAAVDNSLEVPSQIYQESLAYANRKLETIPGEKVLRGTKEERDQQNRLKEIDQQLKILEETAEVLPYLSEEQLNVLLKECIQTPRKEASPPQTKSQDLFLERVTPCCDLLENSILDSRNELLVDVQSGEMIEDQKMIRAEHEDICLSDVIETSDSNLSIALIESHQVETKENNQESQEKSVHNSSSEGYYMAKALSPDKPRKPSFLDEPFYCISMNNELSTDVDIPSMPLKTGGGEVLNKPLE
ncbi:fibrous sheath-interacting protein 1 isoform X2 [Anolis carolinensis]|uniref:fibrous sheath-interacting protein 1 isoform X2 n=1 Tax=Anolis carolinensis TaxID=28377 RepID=UPI000462DCC4|nr:PREDICTED: fibrous sheath-interacting protein 1 isoform X2 [Anolis carolinensis]|eukprot:XP_008115055.1 PREDICTED: fibrous sheath-interacting protein 1 isoform X2 [Anolis carolinensis]